MGDLNMGPASRSRWRPLGDRPDLPADDADDAAGPYPHRRPRWPVSAYAAPHLQISTIGHLSSTFRCRDARRVFEMHVTSVETTELFAGPEDALGQLVRVRYEACACADARARQRGRNLR